MRSNFVIPYGDQFQEVNYFLRTKLGEEYRPRSLRFLKCFYPHRYVTWDRLDSSERDSLLTRFQRSPRQWYKIECPSKKGWRVWIKNDTAAVEFALRFL
jgi:hypothetical protein